MEPLVKSVGIPALAAREAIEKAAIGIDRETAGVAAVMEETTPTPLLCTGSLQMRGGGPEVVFIFGRSQRQGRAKSKAHARLCRMYPRGPQGGQMVHVPYVPVHRKIFFIIFGALAVFPWFLRSPWAGRPATSSFLRHRIARRFASWHPRP